jgi:phenylpropionate dioxygenase-like ring-hydroxylating dioxygenase large terminal subunit
LYTDACVLKQEKESVFGRTWQLVGRLDAVSRPGQFFTAMIADEPLLVVRDNRERLRAFSNVCRHRAGPVALGEGERKSFQCRYHGWTYALDGHLMGTPEFDGVECSAKEEICEAVQRGLRSGNYRSGRYSVKRESGVHHFHGLLAGSFSSGNLQSAPDRL